MRRRLDLASALIGRPRLLILDEPTTGLDPRSRLGMWDVIRGLVKEGTTLLLTTQYLEEADELADDIVVIDHGKIIAHGTADELKRRSAASASRSTSTAPRTSPSCEAVLARHGDGDITVEEATRHLSVAAGGGSEKLFGVFRELDEAQHRGRRHRHAATHARRCLPAR